MGTCDATVWSRASARVYMNESDNVPFARMPGAIRYCGSGNSATVSTSALLPR